jgi:hypothetical protein
MAYFERARKNDRINIAQGGSKITHTNVKLKDYAIIIAWSFLCLIIAFLWSFDILLYGSLSSQAII